MLSVRMHQRLCCLLILMQVVLATEDLDNKNGKQSNRTERSLCLPMLRVFYLELREELKPNEYIGLTGDHSRLGAWRVNKSLQLSKSDKTGRKWYLRIGLCARDRISYRYFLYKIDRQKNKRILQWEGQMHPRFLQYYEMYHKQGSDVFGEIHEKAVGSFSELETGWLRHEYVIEFQFIWEDQLQFDAAVPWDSLFLKLLALNNEELDENYIDITVSRHSYKDSAYRTQPEDGTRYENGDVVVFRITLPLGTSNDYQLRIYSQNRHPVAVVDILQTEVTDNNGVLQLPLYDYETLKVIGHLQLPYLIIKPSQNLAESINFIASFQHYWPANWPTIEVGQRGIGNSFYKYTAKYVENTIASFTAAAKLHADMLQLNVVLTKDYVPVVWHDFGFYTVPTGTRKIHNIFDLEFQLIMDLTYNELKSKRVFVQKQNVLQEYTLLNTRDTSQTERLFVRLSEVFAVLPTTLGLIIEVKWPQQLQSGFYESTVTLDKNRYVDTLLQLTQTDGCGRPIIFASFDADICTLIKMKQHSFPVMLLTYGRQPTVEAYRDLRTHTFMSAINFAASADILGTAPHAFEFIKRPDRLNFILDLNQVVFLWGDVLNDQETLFGFRNRQVTGLIYSNVERLLPNPKRSSFFKAPELQHIFASQCFISINSTKMATIAGTALFNAAAVTKKTKQSTSFSFWPKL